MTGTVVAIHVADASRARGGVFEGKKAQLQLIPGAASSHPTPGKRGDFYLDKGGRLWFCK